jgi:uncharacterized membrane protein YgaE (UPF0421/DUF939 family)
MFALAAWRRLRAAVWPVLLASLAATVGTGTVALGAIVFVTLSASLIAGAAFVGEGMMFANPAAASAILVVTLHRHRTGGERLIDAVVGGAVALILGVGLFPAEPLSLLRDAERSVLRTLAAATRPVAELLATGARPADEWTLRAGYEIHQQLGALARALATARATVSQPVSTASRQQIEALSGAIEALASTPQPWPPELRAEVGDLAASTIEHPTTPPAERGSVVASILRAAANDLSKVIQTPA